MSILNIPRGVKSAASSLASSITSVDKLDEEELELLALTRHGSRDDLFDTSYDAEDDDLSESPDEDSFERSSSKVRMQL